MKIAPDVHVVERARGGELAALHELLRALQGPVYNLALRMLGQREKAQDATQEILLKVTTHLATWRGESAFGTWVYSIAGNHLLNSRQREPGRNEVSFEALAERLDRGEAHALAIGHDERTLSPEDKLEARRTALSCTQAMLMCLDPPARLAYVLDVIFGLDSPEAGVIQSIAPAAHRKRLSRARDAVHGFMKRRCGLVSSEAPCRCARQVPAKRLAIERGELPSALAISNEELDAAEAGLRELVAMGDAAAAMRGAPAYHTPDALLEGIRRVIEQSTILRS